ncbi:MAG: glycerate dehydrogenase [Verrucomicrobiaceae bacterium]|nr:glycerate dehydrogenase [Verrucomicrobiaceae bacterium]
MNITFLDSSTVTRGDIDFSGFEKFGNFTHYAETSPGEVSARCLGQQVIVTNKVILDSEIMASLPDLQLILVAATGVNVVDLAAARAHEVVVCNVAGYSTPSVAQHAASLLLALCTKVHRLAPEYAKWPDSPIFTRLDHPVTELAGKTCGIVGLGAIGKAVAAIGEALGMHIQALAREGSEPRDSIPRIPHEHFFSSSDVISLHCPLTDENRHLINAETLALMKPDAYLINVSRGPLVDDAALAEALRQDHLAGAGLDVLSVEPPPPGHPLLAPDLAARNLIITPHTAWLSLESRQRLLAGILENLENWLASNPSNRVA